MKNSRRKFTPEGIRNGLFRFYPIIIFKFNGKKNPFPKK